MKTKSLRVLTAVLTAAFFVGGIACECLGADCRIPAGIEKSESSHCHQGQKSESKKQSSHECCGKCSIQKAVLTHFAPPGFSPDRFEIFKAGPGAHFEDLNLIEISLSSKVWHERVPLNLFTENILRTAFSFRGPPQA